MKPLTQRRKILGGVFLVVGVCWSMDMLTGGPAPDAAGAAPAPRIALETVPVPPEPPDLNALIDQITHPAETREPLRVDATARDLFSTPAALAPNNPSETVPEDAESRGAPRDAHTPADLPRALQGIIEGRLPLALIDGRLLRQGAAINGYRLVEIDRDSVVLERADERFTLRLNPAGEGAK